MSNVVFTGTDCASLTCRARCIGGSRPSSERAAWSHSRNQFPLSEKSNTIKPSTNKFITGALRVIIVAEHTCMQATHTGAQKIWRPHVVTFTKLLSPAEMWRRFESLFSAKTPLHSPVQEHTELLLSCHSTHSMCACVCDCCVCDATLSIPKQGMNQACIAGIWYGMPALITAHWLDAQRMPLWGPHEDRLAPVICMHGLLSGTGSN